MTESLVNIEIDGKPYEAARGSMLIEVADAAGVKIPRFCYHKKLTVAANCRMCLVEVEKAPKPLPACATPVMDGMKVFTRSPLAIKAQKSVMEFLLINHPLDCPICDQGGECELQDVAMGYGGDVSRFVERKRVVPDKNLGPLIATEMTRCIHCTRCVRFSEEIAGMPELGGAGRGEDMEIGTYVEQSVDSEMSGNVIDLCPVGALTSKPYRFSARAWEMRQRDSVAPHDAVGSNVHLHVARRRVMRVVPRENEAVNEVWISDRDRFSYEGLYSDDRLLAPQIKRDGVWQQADWESALDFAVAGLARVRDERGAAALGALAAPAATVEELYLLQKLARGIGTSNIDHRLRQADFRDQAGAPAFPSLGVSLADLEQQGAVLLIGANTRKEQPIVNHRLRKAAMAGCRVMSVSAMAVEYNLDVAPAVLAGPARLVGSLAAIAAAAGGGAVDDPTLGALVDAAEPDEAERQIASELAGADRAVLILGQGALNHPEASVVKALAVLVAERTGARAGCLSDGPNAAGAWLAGALPHRKAGGLPAAEGGLDAEGMLAGNLGGYLLLGIEPEYDCADSSAALGAMRAADFVVGMSAFRTEAMDDYADVLLPIAPYAETSGTYVNTEGRWQSFDAAVAPPGEARPAWKVLRVLGNLFDVAGCEYMTSADVLAEVRAAVGETVPEPLSRDALVSGPAAPAPGAITRIGDVPIYATDPLVRRSAPLQATADGTDRAMHVGTELAARLGLESGSSARIRQNGSEAVMAVVVDHRVASDSVRLPCALPETAGLGPAYGPVAVEKA